MALVIVNHFVWKALAPGTIYVKCVLRTNFVIRKNNGNFIKKPYFDGIFFYTKLAYLCSFVDNLRIVTIR